MEKKKKKNELDNSNTDWWENFVPDWGVDDKK